MRYFIDTPMKKTNYYKSIFVDFALDEVFFASLYDSDMQRKIHRFKFVHNHVDDVYFGSLFRSLIDESGVEIDRNCVIVYPPVSLCDRILRGPNHAHHLAMLFPRDSWIPLLCPFQKKFFSGHQSRRNKHDRALVADEYTFLPKYQSSLTGKTVIFVDDLITTGWTAQILWSLLLSAGASRVYGFFLASEKV